MSARCLKAGPGIIDSGKEMKERSCENDRRSIGTAYKFVPQGADFLQKCLEDGGRKVTEQGVPAEITI